MITSVDSILPSVCSSRSSKEHEVPLDHSLLRHHRHRRSLREEDWERPEERIPFVWQIVVVSFYNEYISESASYNKSIKVQGDTSG